MKTFLAVVLTVFAFVSISPDLSAQGSDEMLAELKSWTVTSDSPGRGYPLAGPMPLYPLEMNRAGLQGTCTVKIIVGKDGRVKDVAVLQSTFKEFEAPTLMAVKQWRFIEVVNRRKNERPVGMIVECTLAYVLRSL